MKKLKLALSAFVNTIILGLYSIVYFFGWIVYFVISLFSSYEESIYLWSVFSKYCPDINNSLKTFNPGRGYSIPLVLDKNLKNLMLVYKKTIPVIYNDTIIGSANIKRESEEDLVLDIFFFNELEQNISTTCSFHPCGTLIFNKKDEREIYNIEFIVAK